MTEEEKKAARDRANAEGARRSREEATRRAGDAAMEEERYAAESQRDAEDLAATVEAENEKRSAQKAADLKAERVDAVRRLATVCFMISSASGKPLSPHEAFQRAESFMAHALKLDPDARVFIP